MWSQRISGAAVRVARVQPGAGKYQQVEILILSSNHHIRAAVNQLSLLWFLPYRTVPVLASLLQFPAQLRLASQRELQYSQPRARRSTRSVPWTGCLVAQLISSDPDPDPEVDRVGCCRTDWDGPRKP